MSGEATLARLHTLGSSAAAILPGLWIDPLRGRKAVDALDNAIEAVTAAPTSRILFHDQTDGDRDRKRRPAGTREVPRPRRRVARGGTARRPPPDPGPTSGGGR